MNYYKILEVDRDASPEVIEKAYKTLVKKYHPDLQESNLKAKYEEKIKVINEAYETLSNPNLRAKYDETLTQRELSEEDFQKLSKENENLYNQIDNLKHTMNNIPYTEPNYSQTNIGTEENLQQKYQQELEYQNQINEAKQKAYYDAYIQDLKNRGYKIRYKKTVKDYVKNFIALLITLLILFLIFQIPFIKNFLINLYEENVAIQYIINFISNLLNRGS